MLEWMFRTLRIFAAFAIALLFAWSMEATFVLFVLSKAYVPDGMFLIVVVVGYFIALLFFFPFCLIYWALCKLGFVAFWHFVLAGSLFRCVINWAVLLLGHGETFPANFIGGTLLFFGAVGAIGGAIVWLIARPRRSASRSTRIPT